MLEGIASPHMRKSRMSWRPWYSTPLLKTIPSSEAKSQQKILEMVYSHVKSKLGLEGMHGSAVGCTERTLEEMPNNLNAQTLTWY